jgi:NADH-quinone oxidoreductase subunit C
MESLEQLRDRLLAAFPDATVTLLQNASPSAQHALVVDAGHLVPIACFLRDDPALRLDYCSNVTGVDWPDKEVMETVRKTVSAADGSGDTVVEERTKRIEPGNLEVVYHLYSMALKHGPVVIRLRTGNRSDEVTLPSLTPVWRSCEFQEREVFDLYGVIFDGHPDLRRILMWDAFQDHPMRRDYVEPDDYEWEPTAHGDVAEKSKRHQAAAAGKVPIAK